MRSILEKHIQQVFFSGPLSNWKDSWRVMM